MMNLLTPLASGPDVIVFVTDSDVTLWRPSSFKGGKNAPYLTLTSIDDKLSNQLVDALIKAKARSAQIVLDITDIHLQVESLPRAGLLDQGKVAKRRSQLLYPNAELRRALSLDEGPDNHSLSYLFVAVPGHAQLSAIYNALARAQVWLQNVLLFPVEFWGLHWNVKLTDERQRDFVLLNLGTHVRLLAIENDVLLLARILAPSVGERPELLRQEIQTTQSYLLRKGWSRESNWRLSTFGLPLSQDFAATVGSRWRFVQPATDPRVDLIGKLFAGKKPLMPLVSGRMRQRQWLLRMGQVVQRSVNIAAMLAALWVGVTITQLWRDQSALVSLQQQRDALPGYDSTAQQDWQRLQYWHNQPRTPLPVLAGLGRALPPHVYLRELNWQSAPAEQTVISYSLSLTVSGLRTDETPKTLAAITAATGMDVQQERAENTQQSGQLGGGANAAAISTDYYLQLTPSANPNSRVMP